jgi:pyruvate/2-oxoglutarate dehydrogenase complex dihydrolipoamide dehydrogenase (E3) component
MMATGRKANVANLGLEKVGVELLPSGAIKVCPYSIWQQAICGVV